MGDIVEEGAGNDTACRQQTGRFQHILPDNDRQRNLGTFRKLVIDCRLFGQNIDDMGTVNEFVAVDGGVTTQLLHPGIRLLSISSLVPIARVPVGQERTQAGGWLACRRV